MGNVLKSTSKAHTAPSVNNSNSVTRILSDIFNLIPLVFHIPVTVILSELTMRALPLVLSGRHPAVCPSQKLMRAEPDEPAGVCVCVCVCV